MAIGDPFLGPRTSYHGVVSAGESPTVDKTTDVSVNGVDVRARTVDVVDEARYRFTVRRQTVHLYYSGIPQLITAGIVTG